MSSNHYRALTDLRGDENGAKLGPSFNNGSGQYSTQALNAGKAQALAPPSSQRLLLSKTKSDLGMDDSEDSE